MIPANDTPQPDIGKQPEWEYRITERRLMHLLNELPCQFEGIVGKEIRSRPVTHAPELTKEQRDREYVRGYLHGMGDGIETSEKREAALIQRTREEVLKPFSEFAGSLTDIESSFIKYRLEEIIRKQSTTGSTTSPAKGKEGE